MSPLTAALALIVSLLPAAVLADAGPALGATLPPLLERVDAASPELRAMGAEVDAARERIHHVQALPDPKFSIELRDISASDPNLAPNRVGSTRYQVRQDFPWWGKRDLRREVASAEARQVALRRGGARNDLQARVKLAFSQYLGAQRVREVNEDLRQVLAGVEAIARSRYETGLAPQADVIRAMGERTQLASEALAAEAEQRQAAARLNALLARPADAPLAPPQAYPPLPAYELGLPLLQATLAGANPQLGVQAVQIAAAKSSEALVRLDRYPDLTVGFAPVQTGSRFDKWELMFEINVPLQQETRRSQEREALAMQRAAEARREAVANDLAGELGQAWAGFDAASKQLALLRDTLLPQVQAGFASALASYRDGKLDFASLLDAQRQIRRTRLDLIRVEGEQRARLAEIERLIGVDL